MNVLRLADIWDSILGESNGGYACVGGVVTAVLLEPSTIIDVKRRMILADPSLIVSSVRPDGTTRDIDLLLFTTDKTKMGEFAHNLRCQLVGAVGKDETVPEISLAGYETSKLSNEPWLQFVSQFILHDNKAYLKLGHVVQEIPRETQEDTWLLIWGDSSFRVLHPLAHLCSYLTRSVTGVRPKDYKNVLLLKLRLHAVFPQKEWQKYTTWTEFARLVSQECCLWRAIVSRKPQRITLVFGRYVLEFGEKLPWLVRLARKPDGVIRRMASYALRHSRPSMREL